MKVKKIKEPFTVPFGEFVKVTEAGNIVEVMYSEKRSKGNDIKKIDKDRYVNVKTGEIKEYMHTENRAQNPNELRKTFKKIREIVNCNTAEPHKCRWVTITYPGANMNDPKKLYEDTKKFIKKLRYHYGHFEYIQVAEPHQKGGFHIHMFLIFDKLERAPFIDNKDLEKIWNHGYTDIQKVDNNDNQGAYLTAYLGDIPVEDVKYIKNKDALIGLDIKEGTDGKAYIKGARLHMYPSHFNIFRCSRGVKRPIKNYMPIEKAQKKISSAKLTFEKTLSLSDEESNYENTLNYKYYNRKRK